MKKIFITIIIIILFIYTTVYAGDIPESLMFDKPKALFIGRITSINTDTYSIIPSTVMTGSMEDSKIQVKRFDKYYGTNSKPTAGNFFVAVLLNETTIDDTWVFKTTSDDYKTLKLVSQPYNMVLRYEKYINEGKYFETQERMTEDSEVSITSADVSLDNTEKVKNNKEQSYLINKKLIPLLTVIISGLICFYIVGLKKSHIR
jgi:hypothetical protein